MDSADRRNAQVDAIVRSRLAQIMSAAGVPHSQASQELLFMLPPEFARAYEQLFDAALKLDNGSHTGQGERAGEVGKGPADGALGGTLKGLRIRSDVNAGSAPRVSGGGKKYKNVWTVKDQRALDLKNRTDKRLRGIAREIAEEVSSSGRDLGVGSDSIGGNATITRRCTGCGRAMATEWSFCAFDGTALGGR